MWSTEHETTTRPDQDQFLMINRILRTKARGYQYQVSFSEDIIKRSVTSGGMHRYCRALYDITLGDDNNRNIFLLLRHAGFQEKVNSQVLALMRQDEV